MRYLLAIVFPPAAVLLCGRPVLALMNVVLSLCFWIPGMIHAFFIVNSKLADNRNKQLIRAIQGRMR